MRPISGTIPDIEGLDFETETTFTQKQRRSAHTTSSRVFGGGVLAGVGGKHPARSVQRASHQLGRRLRAWLTNGSRSRGTPNGEAVRQSAVHRSVARACPADDAETRLGPGRATPRSVPAQQLAHPGPRIAAGARDVLVDPAVLEPCHPELPTEPVACGDPIIGSRPDSSSTRHAPSRGTRHGCRGHGRPCFWRLLVVPVSIAINHRITGDFEYAVRQNL